MAWYTDGKHTNRAMPPPSLHQKLASRARMLQDFADLIEMLDWPAHRVECERSLARRCWQAADEAFEQALCSRPPVQLKLFEFVEEICQPK